MTTDASSLTSAQIKDLKVLIDFVLVYCMARHREQAGRALSKESVDIFGKRILLCDDCRGVVAHAIEKRRRCPLEPKPSCKRCHVHCYSREYRAKIREIMRYSGRKMIMRGRLDYLWHYFF
ncbi:MAG: nitrous oxide-stimulated promoter family protein [Geobacteraceae bacterium]